jgi:cell division septum initiation protein DivIVA
MKVGNERIKKKFDELDEKIDLMMNHYRALQLENKELIFQIGQLQAEVEKKKNSESQCSEQEAFIQLRIDRFLEKINSFST